MNHVHAIDTRNADGLHALFLDLAHHGGCLLAGMGGVVHHIEDGPHFVLADNLLQLGRVDGLARAVLQHGDVQLDQLTGLLFQGHALQDFFHLGFHRLVGGYGLRSFGRTSDTKDNIINVFFISFSYYNFMVRACPSYCTGRPGASGSQANGWASSTKIRRNCRFCNMPG